MSIQWMMNEEDYKDKQMTQQQYIDMFGPKLHFIRYDAKMKIWQVALHGDTSIVDGRKMKAKNVRFKGPDLLTELARANEYIIAKQNK